MIEQVSTKDREENEVVKRNTGKFGTGFMTTHLLSEKVLVSGALQKDNRGWRKIYNFVKISSQKEKTWLSTEWVEKNIIEECKNIICSIQIIDNEAGTRIALLDKWGEPNVWIIRAANAEISIP